TRWLPSRISSSLLFLRYDATPEHSCAAPQMRTIWFRTPWSERLAAGISGDPTAKRVHGFSPSCTTWRSITYGGGRGGGGGGPLTMPGRQKLPWRRHRGGARGGAKFSWAL